MFWKVLQKGLAQLQEPPQHKSGCSVPDWRPCQFPASSCRHNLELSVSHFYIGTVLHNRSSACCRLPCLQSCMWTASHSSSQHQCAAVKSSSWTHPAAACRAVTRHWRHTQLCIFTEQRRDGELLEHSLGKIITSPHFVPQEKRGQVTWDRTACHWKRRWGDEASEETATLPQTYPGVLHGTAWLVFGQLLELCQIPLRSHQLLGLRCGTPDCVLTHQTVKLWVLILN